MSDTDLCYLSAEEALQRFRDRSLSPVELMQAIIERTQTVDAKVNALSDKYFDEALQQATRAERRYAEGKPKPRPLEGLPLVVKDDTDIKGKRVTEGSLLYADRIGKRTAPHIERLQRAGAIVHARGTCSEFCAAWITDSRLNGTTRCPWNLEFTPGGSSGGSAASVASGTTILATGSDNAGSIRQPASCCGVVGYKPPHGRIPELAPHNLDITSVVGPITRSVGDAARMQNIMAGPHADDISALPQKIRVPTKHDAKTELKIAYSVDLDFFAVDPQVRANLESTVEALRSAGAVAERVSLGWGEDVHRVGLEHWAHHSSLRTIERYEAHRNELTEYSVWMAERAKEWQAKPYARVVELRSKMYETLGPILHKYDALLCPTTSVASIPATLGPENFLQVDGRRIDADFEWCLTYPFNLLGQLPALSVPSGFVSSGVPSGLQVVTKPFDDRGAFRVGLAVEAVQPWSYTALANRL